MPLPRDTHVRTTARKAALASYSPGRIPSQLMALAKTQVHTFSLGPALPWSRCLTAGTEPELVAWASPGAHGSLSPSHWAVPLTRSALLSAGKELRLQVVKSLFPLQQHCSVQGAYSDFQRTKLFISPPEDAVLRLVSCMNHQSKNDNVFPHLQSML